MVKLAFSPLLRDGHYETVTDKQRLTNDELLVDGRSEAGSASQAGSHHMISTTILLRWHLRVVQFSDVDKGLVLLVPPCWMFVFWHLWQLSMANTLTYSRLMHSTRRS